MDRRLHGVVVAPVTPFKEDLSVDLAGVRRIVRYLVESGVHGLVPCALTGEPGQLTLEEQKQVILATLEAARGEVPVYPGIGRISYLESLALVRWASDIGSDGLFVITPFAASYTVAEVDAYFREVARLTSLPIMLYNTPRYSDASLTPQHLAELSQVENIVSLKEGDQLQMFQVIEAVQGRMDVFTARDSYIFESVMVGARGAVSFAANVAPRLCVEIYEAGVAGDIRRARDLQAGLIPLVFFLVSHSYPALIKLAMNQRGLAVGPARRPHLPTTPAEYQRLCAILDDLQLRI